MKRSGERTGEENLIEWLKAFQSEKSDIQKLRWFLDAARELNSADALDRVLASLLQTTIRLAGVERGFVFLVDAAGELQLASGMDANGNEVEDESTISRNVVGQAVKGGEQFLITDSFTAAGAALPESMVAEHIIVAYFPTAFLQRPGKHASRLVCRCTIRVRRFAASPWITCIASN